MSSISSGNSSSGESSESSEWETEEDDEHNNNDEYNNPDNVQVPRQSTWSKNEAFNPQCQAFTGVAEISPELKAEMTPFQIFRYFVDDSMVREILRQTNLYVEQKKLNQPTAFRKWTQLESNDFWQFTTLGYLMGIVKKPTIKDYWSQDLFTSTPFFGKVMSRNRFEDILRGIHFVDNSQHQNNFREDRFLKLGDFFDSLKTKFEECLTPGEYLCVDESLMLYKGRLAFKQYVPLKRARFGVKFFLVVDCETGVILGIIPYQGKKTKLKFSRSIYGFGGAAVLTLLEKYLNKNHKVVIDNYFVSPQLAQKLLADSTYLLGTVRKNRKGLPTWTGKLRKGSVDTYTKRGMLLEHWQDRRQVLMLNTFMQHEMDEVTTANPRNCQQKPKTVLVYNKKMGAVDNADKQIKPYESIRKTNKWYRKVYFHLMDITMYNSFNCFKILHPNLNMTYYDFIMSLVGEVIAKFPPTKVKKGRPLSVRIENSDRLTGMHLPEKLLNLNGKSNFSDCVYCRMGNRRKMTCFQCSTCKKRLCIDGPNNCFRKFHTEQTLPNSR